MIKPIDSTDLIYSFTMKSNYIRKVGLDCKDMASN